MEYMGKLAAAAIERVEDADKKWLKKDFSCAKGMTILGTESMSQPTQICI